MNNNSILFNILFNYINIIIIYNLLRTLWYIIISGLNFLKVKSRG